MQDSKSTAQAGERVILGRIIGAHGVRGLLRVQPFSEDRDTLLAFKTWMLDGGGGNGSHTVGTGNWREVALISGHAHGAQLLVKLSGIDDRDQAQQCRGSEIAVWRAQLPALAEDEYYWSDLEGLTVVTREGVELGVVERVFATGANDVLVVTGKNVIGPGVIGPGVIGQRDGDERDQGGDQGGDGDRQRLIPFLLDQVVLKVDLQAARIEVDWDPEF